MNYISRRLIDDIKCNEIYRGEYHIKELQESLIDALRYKLKLLSEDPENDPDIKKFEERLKKLKEKILG